MADKTASEDKYLGPVIYIQPEALNKLDYYIYYAKGEISGFGVVSQLSDTELIIDDVFIFEQESSSGGTDISGEALAQGLIELIGKGVDPEKLRLWWHSHANMSSFFSGTDKNTMDNTLTDAPWMISVVGNKSGDYNVRFDSHRPVRFWADNLQLYVWTEEDKRICKAYGCSEEVKSEDEKVNICDHHMQLAAEIKQEVDEKNKPPKVTVTIPYKPKGLQTYEGWWENEAGWGYSYKNTKYCDASRCLTRVSLDVKFCDDHEVEVEAIAIENRKSGKKNEERAGDDKKLDASYEYCDVMSCYESASIYDGYYKGLILCDEHFEKFISMEFKYGEFDRNVAAETCIEIFEYYLLKDEEDWSPNDEDDFLDILSETDAVTSDAIGFGKDFVDAEVQAVDEDMKDDSSDAAEENEAVAYGFGFVDLD